MAGVLSAQEIYAAARMAGFSPDQAVTMTAIALAESGGNTGAHNPNGEDSRGLWQINLSPQAHGNAPWAQDLDLYNPVDNAKAAWMVSHEGQDIRPWTVTHSDRPGGARYAQYMDEARAASAAYGETGLGNFDGPANYQDAAVSAGMPGGEPFSGAVEFQLPDASLPAGDQGLLQRFLDAALAQAGDRYEWGVQVDHDNPNPDTFDCAELVEWAAAQVGIENMADTSAEQYLQLREQGAVIPVEEALRTPGALLFKFSSEPTPGDPLPGRRHVAISLGDGRTIEAMGTKYGVKVAEAGDRFQYGGMIPGLDYGGGFTFNPVPAEPTVVPFDPLTYAAQNRGAVDTDRDMLPDHFEIKYMLDPNLPDTDGDGITDGYELIVLGTKAMRADTDFDQMTDDLELALGFDPLVADNPDPNVPLAVPDALMIDTDGDGLTDWGEERAGTNPLNPDTDADRILDGDELALGSDPLSPGGASPGGDPSPFAPNPLEPDPLDIDDIGLAPNP
jgi:cell wall-associated NlpC family hydrolase